MTSRALAAALLVLPFAPARAAPPPQGGASAAARARSVPFAEAMRRAAVAATQAVVAIEEVRRAESLLGETRSAALPLVTGQASYTRLSSRSSPVGSGRVDPNQESASA